MSKHHNGAQRSALDSIQSPAVREAVEGAMEREEEADDEDVENADSYEEYVRKSETARDKSVAAWNERARISFAKRRAKAIETREARHQTRCAAWALAHDSAINAGNAGLLESVIEKQMESARKVLADAEAKLAQLAKLRGTVVETAVEETAVEETNGQTVAV